MKGEKAFDDFLSIDTMECTQAQKPIGENNAYQATYYRDLVTIFNAVPMEPEDTLVDFGCGLGRVLFYGNSRHYCRTTGIEADSQIYDRLMTNAAGYQVDDEDNYFYFFNPFSPDIFEKVLGNITESVRLCPRDIYLMLYYPTFEYQRVMRGNKFFVLKDIVKLSGYEEDPDEKLYVYHMSRYFV